MKREAEPQKTPQEPPYRVGLRILAKLIADEILRDRDLTTEEGSSTDPISDEVDASKS